MIVTRAVAHACAAAALLCAIGLRANAQSSDSTGRADLPPVAVWATLTLGPGHASNRSATLLGGQLGAFASHGSWIAGYRRGGASGIDSGGAYDDALLVGHRFPSDYATAFIAIGPAKIYDESTGTGVMGVGFAAEVGENVRVLGLGLSTFGAVSRHRSYVGFGLTLDAGWIR